MAQIKTNLQYGVTGSLQTGSIAGDAIDGTKIADDAINSEHLAAGGIDTAHIADDQITLAKMASGTDGNVITYDASGNPAVVSTGTSGHFLKSQGSGSVPVFAAAGGGKIGQVVQGDNSSHFTSSSNSYADIGLSAAITPSASSSKVLVIVYVQAYFSGGALDSGIILHVERDKGGGGYSTVGDDYWGQSYLNVTVDSGHDTENRGSFGNTAIYLDDSNSTDVCTYKVQGSGAEWGGSGVFNHNSRSTITLMEILA